MRVRCFLLQKSSQVRVAVANGTIVVSATLTFSFTGAKGQHLSGKCIDIWSLGVTLFCLVHGHAPFEDVNPVELSRKIETDPLILAEHLSKSLRDLLTKMLE